MSATVVSESMYGNTRAVAEAIAEGLGDAEVMSVPDAAGRVQAADLLVVGGPTHVHGIATKRSRQAAAKAVHEDGAAHLEAEATDEPGLRAWLRDLPNGEHAKAAAFDTRLDKSPWLTGVASRGIAKRLRRDGYDVIDQESFLVEESEGPLAEGELERAREWGRKLASLIPRPAAAARSER
ncbi:MAG: flavodoxin family protein [Solirubrobacterales bacterium]|nr:flavodoxin family protein [Solirubrobacterales bacterium]